MAFLFTPDDTREEEIILRMGVLDGGETVGDASDVLGDATDGEDVLVGGIDVLGECGCGGVDFSSL